MCSKISNVELPRRARKGSILKAHLGVPSFSLALRAEPGKTKSLGVCLLWIIRECWWFTRCTTTHTRGFIRLWKSLCVGGANTKMLRTSWKSVGVTRHNLCHSQIFIHSPEHINNMRRKMKTHVADESKWQNLGRHIYKKYFSQHSWRRSLKSVGCSDKKITRLTVSEIFPETGSICPHKLVSSRVFAISVAQ